jgi:hypothetical protein
LLISLNQNGKAVGYPLEKWGYTDIKTAGGEARPNPCFVHYAKRGKPVPFPAKAGKPTVREADGWCG